MKNSTGKSTLSLIITTISLLSLNPIIYAQNTPKTWSYKPPQNIGKPSVTLPAAVRDFGIVSLIPVVPEVEKCSFKKGEGEFQVEEKKCFFALTVQAYPTFLIYIPELNKNTELKYAQFSLKDKDGNKEIYKSDFPLNTNNQIISISLPNDAALSPLQVNQDYQWSFSIFSDSLRINYPEMISSGVIRRVELPPKLQSQQILPMNADKQARVTLARLHAESGIWYDSAAIFSQLYREYPNDVEIKKDWEALLKSVKLDDLVGKPLVSSNKQN